MNLAVGSCVVRPTRARRFYSIALACDCLRVFEFDAFPTSELGSATNSLAG
jgi:hypothetical protein